MSKSQESPEGDNLPPPKMKSWQIWVEKNSKPKPCKCTAKKRHLTRFQKNGPIDWQQFLRWAHKKAKPKRRSLYRPKKRKAAAEQNKIKYVVDMKRIASLSLPKKKRDKYTYIEPVFTFSPKIKFCESALSEKGRPFQPILLPYWWYHDEIRDDFWRWLRFPISQPALKHKTNRKDYEKLYPKKRKPHCLFADRPEDDPPERIKMTQKQWKEHSRRLLYLADPSFKDTRHLFVKAACLKETRQL